MKKVLGFVFSFVALFAMVTGGVYFYGVHKHSTSIIVDNAMLPIIEVQDPSLEQYATMWQKEAQRRFGNHSCVILTHGGSFLETQFIVKSSNHNYDIVTAKELVEHYQKMYGNSFTYILIVCNPKHLKLGIPGVYYASDSVFCIPNRYLQSHSETAFLTLDGSINQDQPGQHEDRSTLYPGIVSDIYEFNCD